MKKFKILQELPKCETETLNEKMLFQKSLDVGWPQTFNFLKMQYLQSAIKWNTDTIKQGMAV